MKGSPDAYDFSGQFVDISGRTLATLSEAKKAGAATLNYGLFLNTILDFLIVVFAVFLQIRQVNKMKRQPEPAPVEPAIKDCPYCLSGIPVKAIPCGHCTSQIA